MQRCRMHEKKTEPIPSLDLPRVTKRRNRKSSPDVKREASATYKNGARSYTYTYVYAASALGGEAIAVL